MHAVPSATRFLVSRADVFRCRCRVGALPGSWFVLPLLPPAFLLPPSPVKPDQLTSGPVHFRVGLTPAFGYPAAVADAYPSHHRPSGGSRASGGSRNSGASSRNRRQSGAAAASAQGGGAAQGQQGSRGAPPPPPYPGRNQVGTRRTARLRLTKSVGVPGLGCSFPRILSPKANPCLFL